MILHLGADTVVRMEDLLAIVPEGTVTENAENRILLDTAKRTGRFISVSDDPVKSYVFCTREDVILAYASPISAATLVRRAEEYISRK